MEAAAGIGDNGAPFDFYEFFDLVVNSSATTTEKLIALVTGRHIGRNGEAAYPSRARTAKLASCSPRNLERSLPVVRVFFLSEQRAGKATLYRPKPSLTTEDVEAAFAAIRDAETPRQNVGTDKATPRQGDVGTPRQADGGVARTPRQNDGTPPVTVTGQKDLLNDKKEKETPLPPKGRSRRDPFGLNAALNGLHHDVWFDDDDRLQVANGFRAELLGIVGDEAQLRIELDRAVRYCGPNTPGTVLKSKVRGQIQHQMADKRDRDERYAKTVAARAAAPPGRAKNWHEEQDELLAKYKALRSS